MDDKCYNYFAGSNDTSRANRPWIHSTRGPGGHKSQFRPSWHSRRPGNCYNEVGKGSRSKVTWGQQDQRSWPWPKGQGQRSRPWLQRSRTNVMILKLWNQYHDLGLGSRSQPLTLGSRSWPSTLTLRGQGNDLWPWGKVVTFDLDLGDQGHDLWPLGQSHSVFRF